MEEYSYMDSGPSLSMPQEETTEGYSDPADAYAADALDEDGAPHLENEEVGDGVGYADTIETDDDNDFVPPEETPPANLDEAAERARGMLQSCQDAMGGIEARLGADACDRLGNIHKARIAALGHPAGAPEKLAMCLDIITEDETLCAAGGNAQDIAAARELVASFADAHATANEYALAEYSVVRQELTATTDWDAVIARHLAGDGFDNLPDVFRNINCQFKFFESNIKAADDLRALQAEVKLYGDMVPDAGALEIPPEWQPDPQRLREMAAWYADAREVGYYMAPDRYRHNLNEIGGQKAILLKMEMLCGRVSFGDDADHAPLELMHALERTAGQLQETYEAADAQYVREYVEASPPLTIQNVEYAQEVFGATDADAWVKALLLKIPTAMSYGLRGVVFHRTGYERYEDGTVAIDNREPSGGWASDDGTIHIVVGTSEKPVSRSYIATVVVHEIGHNAHRRTASFAQLRRWVAVCRADPEGAPQEVVKEAALPPERQRRGFRADNEDFACSFVRTTFTQYAQKLRARSPERYAYFDDFVRGMPADPAS